MTLWLIAVAVLIGGLALVLGGRRIRRGEGLGEGRTLDLDCRTLYSGRYGLSGRPDRLIREGKFVVPEEWKSSKRVHDSHRAQIGVYFMLIEEAAGLRPPHGYVVTGDGARIRVENANDLRAMVLRVADGIRAARRLLDEPIRVDRSPNHCRTCGQRENCAQRRE